MEKLQEIILSEMSRRNIDFVVQIVQKNPAAFDYLFEMAISNQEPLSRRAFWALDKYVEQNPEPIKPKIASLIEAFSSFTHDAHKRHSLRILRNHNIPEEHESYMIDLCFQIIQSGKESIACKAFSMDILFAFSEKEPGLKPELAASIELQMHNASRGVKNKSKKMLKKLYLQMNKTVG